MSGDYTNTYWSGKGKYEGMLSIVSKLIPVMGPCKNPKSTNKWLERLRVVQNAYWDVYNNGGGNRDSSIKYWFNMDRWEIKNLPQRCIDKMEDVVDEIVLSAFEEQLKLGRIKVDSTENMTTDTVQLELLV